MHLVLKLTLDAKLPRNLADEEKALIAATITASFEDTLDIIFDQDNPDIGDKAREQVKRLLAEARDRAARRQFHGFGYDGAAEGGLPL